MSALIAILLLEVEGVAAPDGVSQFVDEFEDRECLLGCPVCGNLERDGEGRASVGFGHDLDLRLWRARLSARSWASLKRYDSPSMARISAWWTRRSTRETTQVALGILRATLRRGGLLSPRC